MKGVFPCSYELWAYGDQQCPCDPDLHAVAASSSFPAALSEPGSCRMGPHVSSGTHGRVLERRSPPPGEMFSQLYDTGCTTLCAMSASVQEKQAALSQLPARLLPPAVRAPPAAMRAKIDRLARHQLVLLAHTALQQGQVDWDVQATVKRINASLIERGYVTWFDLTNMKGIASTLSLSLQLLLCSFTSS